MTEGIVTLPYVFADAAKPSTKRASLTSNLVVVYRDSSRTEIFENVTDHGEEGSFYLICQKNLTNTRLRTDNIHRINETIIHG